MHKGIVHSNMVRYLTSQVLNNASTFPKMMCMVFIQPLLLCFYHCFQLVFLVSICVINDNCMHIIHTHTQSLTHTHTHTYKYTQYIHIYNTLIMNSFIIPNDNIVTIKENTTGGNINRQKICRYSISQVFSYSILIYSFISYNLMI